MNENGQRTIYPPHYFFSAAGLMVVLHNLMPLRRLLTGSRRAAGIAPMAAGLLLGFLGSRQFNQAGTTLRPGDQSTTLVTDGVFRYSRNPMYLGMVLMLDGLAVLFGTLTPFLVIPLFAWLIRTRFIEKEEKAMEAQFGQRYINYKRRTRRWL